MLKRKLLSILVIISLITSILGAPVFADSQTGSDQGTPSTTQTAESNTTAGNPDLGSTQPTQTSGQILGDNSSVTVNEKQNQNTNIDKQANSTAGQSFSLGSLTTNNVSDNSQATDTTGGPLSDSAGNSTPRNDVSHSIGNNGDGYATSGSTQALNNVDGNVATISPDTTVTVDAPGYLINSNVIVNILYNYLANIAGHSNAQSGESTATGLAAENSIENTATARSKGDSSLMGGPGTYNGSAAAVNQVNNSIDNKGSAGAATGDANAQNNMTGNSLLIAPIVDTIIKLCGDIVNSNVVIDLVYNFLANLAGEANATTGNSSATGANVSNDINNYAKANAQGDAPIDSSGGGPFANGSALALNKANNGIANDGNALSSSGSANATNTMKNNSINVAPNLANELDLLGPIEDSDVLIRVTYNFYGAILGQANAETGDTTSTGLAANNSIDNTSTARAVGDAPIVSSSGNDGTSGSVGGVINGEAAATNATNNLVGNKGSGVAVSGDANSTNTMEGNKVDLSPELYTIMTVAKPIIEEGKVIIDVVYNIWSVLSGSAGTTTGNSSAMGSASNNSIASNSNARAFADVGFGGPNGYSGGPAYAENSTNNVIGNNGLGVAVTGNANARNDLSNAKTGVNGALQQNVIVDPFGDDTITAASIITGISQEATAATGNTDATGNLAASSETSDAKARSIFGDSSQSKNKVDNEILNIGKAGALTKDAYAVVGILPSNSGGIKPPGGSKSSGGDNGKGSSPSGDQLVTGSYMPNSYKIGEAIFASDSREFPGPRYSFAGEVPSLADGSNVDSGEDLPGGSKVGSIRKRLTQKPESNWWIWAIVAALLAAWAGITLKAKPWLSMIKR